ncbi:GNAT family N-acetyltransferase [Amycolatopsis albispora]|uniref:Acetyltransferase n=1 Tax=Amycolatopsis albispora TaxID=1804986 RepID=A0A344L2U1_9PSEU|nr:GNAT family N-acetyltransferase [Amycolatopsis albispora]AXB42365.1 acetyltransferase [Amycolatopsis albispora]
MTKIRIRAARPAEFEAVAGLRWRWVAEQDGLPDTGRDAFVGEFAQWTKENAATHRCLVVLREDEVIGMGFLAITPRVPTPRAFERASGDVQCVYVVPEARDGGVGGQLIEALLRLADDLGLERVTVHSSARAIPAYERCGFAASPKLLQLTGSGHRATRSPVRPENS